MKAFKLFLLLFCFINTLTFAQYDSATYWINASKKPDANFYEIEKAMDSYFNRNKEAREHSGFYKAYARWADFWRNRVVNLPNNNGNMYDAVSFFNEAMEQIPETPEATGTIGSEWGYFGPSELPGTQLKGLVESLAIDYSDPSLNTIYAGTNASGIWKTTDGGKFWRCITDRNGFSNVGIQDIAIAPNEPNTLLAATGITTYGRAYGIGVIKSTNGGQTWSKVSFPRTGYPYVSRIAFAPGSSTNVVAAIESDVYISKDQGNTWTRVFHNKLDSIFAWTGHYYTKEIFDIKFKPGDPNTVYLASTGTGNNSSGKSSSEIWRMTNIFATDPSTITYKRIDTLGIFNGIWNERWALDVKANEPDKLYISGALNLPSDTVNKYYYLATFSFSSNSFTVLYNQTVNDGNYDHELSGLGYWRNEFAVSKKLENVYYVGGYAIDKVDLSDNIPLVTHYYIEANYHVDTREIKTMIGLDGNEYIFAANDGGVSKGNQAFGFENINGRGLNITQFWGLGSLSTNAQLVGAGAQDNGGFTCSTNGNWNHHRMGDGYDMLYHTTTPNRIYATTSGPGVLVNTDGGGVGGFQSLIADTIFLREPGLFDKPIKLLPGNPVKLLVGKRDVWKSDGTDAVFTRISHFAVDHGVDSSERLVSIALAPSDVNTLYVAYANPHWNNNAFTKKVFKTTNGGTLWVNITSGLTPLSGKPITEMIVDPDNAQKLWVTFGAFNNPGPGGSTRIWFTSNGGTTWQAFANNQLPDLPINCIELVKVGNVKKIFIGTDAGVYMYPDASNATLAWEPFNNNLPKCIVSELEYNPTAKKLRASTFGRGIWETSIDCYTTTTNETIAAGPMVTWATPSIHYGNVIINQGATLKITSKTEFMQDKYIIVMPGGKLIVDGSQAQLTSHCNGLWGGIKVKGSPTAPFSSTTQHGIAEFKNNCLIENAKVAVATVADEALPDGSGTPAPYYYVGGIIKAENTTFANNYISVSIQPCQTTKIDRFVKCSFTTNKLLPNPYYFPAYAMVTSEVKGIRVAGCKFISDTVYYSYPVGIGLLANNSSLTVIDTLGVASQFHNLAYGVKALAASATRLLKVDKAWFNRCLTGLYGSGLTMPKVWRNRFRVVPIDTIQAKPYGGLYLDHCTGYSVTENTFYGYNGTGFNGMKIGMVINNSGPENNLIYNNTLKGMKFGVLAQNNNRNSQGNIGLVIKCNDFYSTNRDIAVTSASQGSTKGIRNVQGINSLVPRELANNRFSHSGLNGIDILNEANCNPFNYYMPDTLLSYVTCARKKFISASVTAIQKQGVGYDKSTNCPADPLLADGGGSIDGLRDALLATQAGATALQEQLDALVDGGEPEATLLDVQTSGTAQSFDLYQDLLLKSPYLSDSVLKSMALNEEALSNAMLRDVYTANPQTAKRPDIVSLTDTRWEPLPTEMKEDIEANAEVVGAKEVLESNLAAYNEQATALYQQTVNYWLNDPQPTAADSLNAFLATQNTVQARYQLAWRQAEAGYYNEAKGQLQYLEANAQLTNEAHAELLGFDSLITYTQANALLGLPGIYTDSLHVQGLLALAESNAGLASAYARNILLANALINYNEPYILPSTLKAGKTVPKSLKAKTQPQLVLGPNPSKGFVIAKYQLSNATGACLHLTDVKASYLYTLTLTKARDEVVVPLEGLQAGAYFVSLSQGGKTIATAKLIVQ